MNVIYSGLYYDDCHPFNALCANTEQARSPDELKESDSALVIWGGADIHPDYYGHPMHRTTHPGGMRDKHEWGLMQRAIEKGIPIFGVCRGAQMLTAAAGGFLIQDVKGHLGTHGVETFDGQKFTVNSIHHQMMVPGKAEHELVAWSETNRSTVDGDRYYGYRDDAQYEPPAGWKEPEFIYYPKINGYAIQWHPEGMRLASEATQYILAYIERKEYERNGRRQFPVCVC